MARRESSDQIMLVARIRQFMPDVTVFSIPNSGRRDPREGARMKAEGMLAGIPDLFVAYAAHGYHGLFIEMKRITGGRLSTVQCGVIDELRAAGYKVVVPEGVHEAWREVCEYTSKTQFVLQ